MPQSVVNRRPEDVINQTDAISRHIVLPDEAKYLSSITKVGQGGCGTIFALRFKNGTLKEMHRSKMPNHVKPSFALKSLTCASVLLGR
jgi:hypothetical protein